MDKSKCELYYFKLVKISFEDELSVYQNFKVIIISIKVSEMSEFDQQDLKNFKTIIVGRSAVGKSTLLLRYVEG